MVLAAICILILCAALFGHLVGDADQKKHKAPMLVLAAFLVLALIFAGPNVFYWLLSLIAFYF